VLAIFTQTNNGSCTATPFHTVRNTRSTLKLKFLVRFGPTPTANRTGFGGSPFIAPVDPPKPRAPGFHMLECKGERSHFIYTEL
jgi:hypothetical protein